LHDQPTIEYEVASSNRRWSFSRAHTIETMRTPKTILLYYSMFIICVLIAKATGRGRDTDSKIARRQMIEALLADSVNASRVADFIKMYDLRKEYEGKDRSDWMGSLPKDFTYLPLTEIAIPGSHDSFTALSDPNGPIGPRENKKDPLIEALNKLHKWFPSDKTPASKKIIYNWVVTQSLTLSDQLKAGVRYFDFRVATKPGDQKGTHLVHTLYSQSTRSAFLEIKTFLDIYLKEVVIIDLKKFYVMEDSHHERLIREITDIFGNMLVKPKRFDHLTLKKLWADGKQVIISYHDGNHANRNSLWTGRTTVISKWPNTNKQSKAFKKLNQWTKQRARNQNANQPFWVTQGILTPTAKDIGVNGKQFWKGLWTGKWGSLKTELGSPMCSAISAWLKSQKSGRGGINIVITDFVEEYNFIENVLALNRGRGTGCFNDWKAGNHRDNNPKTCQRYIEEKWCTEEGDFGPSWKDKWGSFTDYADANGNTAWVCPQCGCGKA